MQPSTSFNIPTLALIGPGLIGGSLAAALKSAGVVQQVLGVGRDANSLRQAQDLGLIDRPVSVAEAAAQADVLRSEEHTSELQSRGHLVCRLLLENKKEK